MRRAALLLALACAGPEDADPGETDALVAVLPERLDGLVGEPVTFDASGSTGAVAARWDFGDGHGLPAGSDLVVTHVYDTPGRRTASVEVVDDRGGRAVARAEVSVTWPLLDPAPRAASSVVVAGRRAFVAMPDFDAVAVVDLDARATVDHLRPCPRPRRLAHAPGATGLLAVTCEERAPGVALFDVTDAGVTPRALLDLTGFGRSPFAVVIGDGRRVWVAARDRAADGGLLLELDDAARVLGEHRLDGDVRGLAWRPGELFVARWRAPDDGGRIWRLATDDGAVAAHVLPVDTRPDTDIHSRGVPSMLGAVAIRPDGRAGVVGGLKANVLRGLVRDGLPLTHETTVRALLLGIVLSPDDGVPGVVTVDARLDDRDLVSAVAYHPRGDRLYAATYGARTVEIRDAHDLGGLGAWHDVGTAVDGLAVTADGAELLAHASLDRELVVLDATAPPGAPLARIDLLPPEGEVLDPLVLEGARIFSNAADPRMTKDGYVSCASCHFDGEEDGRTWDFTDRGEGLRNTISLRGMADRAGGPVHWSGNFDEIQDFEVDIRGPQAGRGFLPDEVWRGEAGPSLGAPKAGRSAALDALAAYVESLEPLDVPWDIDVDEGRAVFVAAGCDACHPDGHTTSTEVSGWEAPGEPVLVDVGTLRPESGTRLGGPLTGLDVPSLRGVWATAPYLHDGSAATLRDVVIPCGGERLIGCNPDDRHGVTSDLDPAALDALVRYLRSL